MCSRSQGQDGHWTHWREVKLLRWRTLSQEEEEDFQRDSEDLSGLDGLWLFGLVGSLD